MTREQLDAIRARVDSATPGPWEAGTAFCCPDCGWVDGPKRTVCPVYEGTKRTHTLDASDAEFIAHAREDVPALLAEVERLNAERNALKPKASTVCTFQFPNGKWGWVVSPGPVSGGPPTDTHEEAVVAGKALAHREGWPEIRALPDPEDKS